MGYPKALHGTKYKEIPNPCMNQGTQLVEDTWSFQGRDSLLPDWRNTPFLATECPEWRGWAVTQEMQHGLVEQMKGQLQGLIIPISSSSAESRKSMTCF